MAKQIEIATKEQLTALYVDIKRVLDKGLAVTLEPKHGLTLPTQKMIAYYFAAIVPAFQSALRQNGRRKSLKEIDEALRLENAYELVESVDGQGVYKLPKSLAALDKNQMRQFIDDCLRTGGKMHVCFDRPQN